MNVHRSRFLGAKFSGGAFQYMLASIDPTCGKSLTVPGDPSVLTVTEDLEEFSGEGFQEHFSHVS